MKCSEFRRWLLAKGATLTPGKGSHFKLTLGSYRSTFADHGSKELPDGTRRKIIKDLGLKD